MKNKDIIIIGGGASGMLCAIRAKERYPEKSVAILEKQSRIGRKLLSTGNGRCNLTNTNMDRKYYHGSFKKYCGNLLEKYTPDYVTEQFGKMGLLTHADSAGRVYPVSNHASSVLDVLRFRLEALDVEIICDCAVSSVFKRKGKFEITAEKGKFICDKLVVTTGSCAAPKLGADKSGYGILESLSHKIISPNPALCPVPVKSDILPSVKGVRAAATVTLLDNGKYIKQESGEIQFTEKALSGICVFNLSSDIHHTSAPEISVNLLPDKSQGEILILTKNNKDILKKKEIKSLFTGILVEKLGIAVLKAAGINRLSGEISDLTSNEIVTIAETVSDLRFRVQKPSDFNTAQVCAGGVSGNELDPESMESKLNKGLYICGEAVDINGDCGGYNLHFAFASGLAAGDSL